MNLSIVLLLLTHISVMIAFGLACIISRSSYRRTDSAVPSASVKAGQVSSAPYSRALVLFHGAAFWLMYKQIGMGLLEHSLAFSTPDLPLLGMHATQIHVIAFHLNNWIPPNPVAGGATITLSGLLMTWAMLYFRSWRFRAALDEGHELATGGPFRFFRHPIYLGLNLLALGTALWLPTPSMSLAFALMVIGGDLRARAEEKLLTQAFGKTYEDYLHHTCRFIPILY